MKRNPFTLDIIALIVLGAGPLAWLIWQVLHNGLGANPIEALIRQLGVWGLRFLVLGLCITPLSKLLRQAFLIRWRRPIGIWAFVYICLHLTTYFTLDLELSIAHLIKDVIKRPFITLGMLGFLLLIPLALTSFNWASRKMGYRRWQSLHKLVYLIVPLGVVHYYLLVKAKHTPPIIYGVIVLILLGYRFVADRIKKAR